MRSRLGVGILGLVLVAVLVNLPLISQWRLSEHLRADGFVVSARVVEVGTGSARGMVRYRVPGAAGTSLARVDETTLRRVLRSRRLPVRTLPGDPTQSRPVGESGGAFVPLVTFLADAALLGALALLVGRRRMGRVRVEETSEGADGLLRVRLGERSLWALAPSGPPRRRAALRLRATGDIETVPDGTPPGLERRTGASYVAVGVLRDARRGRCRIQVGEHAIEVELTHHRNRASLRDAVRVPGTLLID